MRGIQVNAQLFRGVRQARGITQRELATLAGVGERTVRNAESGRRVRLDFLNYLATALSVEVIDLVDDRDELQLALREEGRVQQILTAIDAFATAGDYTELFGLLARDARIVSPGPPEIPISGEYRGLDGMRTFFDRSAAAIAYEGAPTINEIRASGNLVVITGQDWLRAIPTGKSFSSSWMHIYEFEKGRIARIDNWGELAVIQEAFQPG